ncbi:MAG: Rieske 2Fe-2S domain-containing protein [Planctomycetaceae bacterium]|nr:Rieske 2Fe-2S domain-containing protein [Planctomycetaceae bacterium]
MAKKNNNEESSASAETNADNTRRDFIKTTVAAGITACALGTPICAGVRTVLYPATQSGGTGQFFTLAVADSITDKPAKFSVIGDQQDAWITKANQNIGSVFIVKIGEEIKAFHSLCPHAGCMIQFGKNTNPKTGTEEDLFYCPCHAAHFALNGERLDGVSPRDLDSLEVKIEDGNVQVKFENFVFGIADKRA